MIDTLPALFPTCKLMSGDRAGGGTPQPPAFSSFDVTFRPPTFNSFPEDISEVTEREEGDSRKRQLEKTSKKRKGQEGQGSSSRRSNRQEPNRDTGRNSWREWEPSVNKKASASTKPQYNEGKNKEVSFANGLELPRSLVARIMFAGASSS